MNTELNHYYLDAMGIQRWVVVKPKADAAARAAWSRLQSTVATCQACDLHQGRTNTVFGVGNKQADLIIVGEAPGYHEDQQGEPFVGRAGQLLDRMLKAINLERQQVYIANVLKCRPPKNRDPLPREIQQCTEYLDQQLALLQPKLILAVGRYAAHYLLQCTTPLSRLRGRTHYYGEHQIPLIVSYHPAYLLRNPIDKRKAYSDLLQVSTMLQ